MNTPAFTFVQRLGQELAAGEFDLPPFPDTALRVQACVSDPDSDIRSLAAIVATEPALAARLMRMANSALMRRGPMEVQDINTAISRVGMSMVQNAAVSFAAREAFQFPPGSTFLDELNKLRKHSLRTAAISYVLARGTNFSGSPDEAMLTGLLHSVGKFYIFMKVAEYPELFDSKEAMEGLLSQWHTGVAKAIVESWNFPETVSMGVDEQELKERDRIGSADLSDLLFIANILARAGTKAASELGDLDALARLRMTPEQLAKMLEEKEEELQSMIDALSS